MSESIDLARVYAHVEDCLVPYLRLGLGERATYYHLLRHSLLEGRRRVEISKRALARNIGCSATTVHGHLRRLAEKGCIRIVERNLAGHTIEVYRPDEVPGCVAGGARDGQAQLDAADCFRNERLRAAILRREDHRCFYCLRQLRPGATVFDHAVPVCAGGDSSYRNVVACCFECNAQKGEREAAEFLRELYRAGRLSGAELDGRMAAVEALRAGELVPA